MTISPLHFDHAGGTSRFPKTQFIVQRRELEYAADGLPHNSAAKGAFVAEDVLAMVNPNWQGRVLLVDGDIEGVLTGVDVYLTAGHTAGTMTACLDTAKGRVCYSSDAVHTYRNIDEEIPLGLALNAGEAVESYKNVRRILRGGRLIPGHEPRIFEGPKSLGFRKVSEHAVAIVDSQQAVGESSRDRPGATTSSRSSWPSTRIWRRSWASRPRSPTRTSPRSSPLTLLLDSADDAFPSAALAACAAESARGRSCQILDAAYAMTRDCDAFDSGAADANCQ